MAVSTPIISYSNYSLLDFLVQMQLLQGQPGKQGPRGRDGKRGYNGKPGKKGDSVGLPGVNGKTILYGSADPLPNQGVLNGS